MKLINQLPADVRDNTTHYIQDLIIEGREEERAKTKRTAVKNMLRMNADIDFICEALDVPKQYVMDLRENMKEEKSR